MFDMSPASRFAVRRCSLEVFILEYHSSHVLCDVESAQELFKTTMRQYRLAKEIWQSVRRCTHAGDDP